MKGTKFWCERSQWPSFHSRCHFFCEYSLMKIMLFGWFYDMVYSRIPFYRRVVCMTRWSGNWKLNFQRVSSWVLHSIKMVLILIYKRFLQSWPHGLDCVSSIPWTELWWIWNWKLWGRLSKLNSSWSQIWSKIFSFFQNEKNSYWSVTMFLKSVRNNWAI